MADADADAAAPGDLDRFVEAQDADRTYDRALDELRAGRKRTHWMWFVFPQLDGLGTSAVAQRYGIRSLEEARAYLRHPILGPRLRSCTAAVLALPDADPAPLLGPVDARKLRSSMTLFHRADSADRAFRAVLDRCFAGQPDPLTDARLGGSSGRPPRL